MANPYEINTSAPNHAVTTPAFVGGGSTNGPTTTMPKATTGGAVQPIDKPKEPVQDYSALTAPLSDLQKKLTALSSGLGNYKPEAVDVNGLGETPPPIPPTPSDNVDTLTGLQSQFDSMRDQVQAQYQAQIDSLQLQIDAEAKKEEEAKGQTEQALDQYGNIAKQPLADTVTQGMDKYKIDENYFANQALIGELGTIMNELNMSAIRNTEMIASGAISKTEANRRQQVLIARAGTIEAVIGARNNQIGNAFSIIDKTYNALKDDQTTQLNYYESLINYYDGLRTESGAKIVDLTKDQRTYINSQIGLKEAELENLSKSTEYIKSLMINPDTAKIIADAGVSLADNVDEINEKLAKWGVVDEQKKISLAMMDKGYKEILPGEVSKYSDRDVLPWTDSNGKVHYYIDTQGALNQLLSVTEARAFGVPYGTTREGVVGQYSTGAGGDDDPNKLLTLSQVIQVQKTYPEVKYGMTQAQAMEVMNRDISEQREAFRTNLQAAKDGGATYDEVIQAMIASYNEDQTSANRITTPEELEENYTVGVEIAKEVYGLGTEESENGNWIKSAGKWLWKTSGTVAKKILGVK